VIVGVWGSDKLRSSVSNAFIVSLAGADLMVALLVMPFSAVQVCHLYTHHSVILWTRSQAVARIADRTPSQHLWGSRTVIDDVTIW